MLAVPLIVFALALALWSVRTRAGRGAPPFAHTVGDYRRHYSRRRLLQLGGGVALGAVLVYSGADVLVHDWHTRSMRGERSHAVAGFWHFFGERFWAGYWALFLAVDAFWQTTPLSRFGRRAFEALLVGLPSLWIVQRVLGASRPSEGRGPAYRPFADDNSASGHTFIGAVPWIVAARSLPHPAARAVAWLLSGCTGWSRINDHKHYLSQVILGYLLAWGAVDTVMTRPTELPVASDQREAETES